MGRMLRFLHHLKTLFTLTFENTSSISFCLEKEIYKNYTCQLWSLDQRDVDCMLRWTKLTIYKPKKKKVLTNILKYEFVDVNDVTY